MQPKTDLKTCPFCGHPAEYRQHRYLWYCVVCPMGHVESPEFDNRAEAKAWWNRRSKK